MAKVDRSTRDINQRVKRAVGGTSKRAENAGKMFLHVGGEFLKANFPTPFAFVETNKDVLDSTTKFLRNPVDSVNRQINRALGTDDFKALKKLAKNTLADLKSGNYYDPDRQRSADMEMLNNAMSELDNFDFDFGGFDLSEFDENGDWVDTSNDSAKADITTQLKVAALQDAKDDARTTATVNAIVTGTQAQIQNDNSNNQVSIRMMLKQHSEVMQSQENLIQGQQATFELISKSSEAHANLFREAHNQVMGKLDTTIDLLKKIEENTQKPKQTKFKKKENVDLFGSKGEIDLKAYKKLVKKNISDKLSGIGISGGGLMGIPLQQILEAYGDNPVASILEIALNAAIPKKTRNQMERTSQNMQNFLPALLQKMADRGRRYETGKSDSKFDMLMGLLAPTQESNARISTRNDDILKAAQITGKTVKAIEEVIPMWLARIDSHLTGGPMMVYDYKDGKLKNAGKVISDNERYNRDMTGNVNGYYEAISRARGYKFKNEDEQKKFLDFVHMYFQNAAENDKFVNPWASKKDFMSGVEAPEGSNYYEMLAAILRNMNPESSGIKGSNKAAIVNLISSIRGARASRNDRNFRTNKDLRETGEIAAWSFMDDDLRKDIISRSMGSQELSATDIENISQERRKSIMKQGGLNANNVLLSDILKTLRAGIITYSMKPSTVENLPDYVKEKLRVKNTPRPRGSYSTTAQAMNDPASAEVDELYANVMSMDQLMEQQGTIYYNKTEDECQREIDRLRKEGKDPVNRYNTTIRDKAKYYEKAFQESNFGKIVATTREIANKPFQLFNSAMQMIDDMIYKTLLGTDALPEGQKDGPIDRNESPSILKMTMNIIAGQFNRLSGFIASSLNRLDDYLFAPEHGLIPRAVKSVGEILGFDELKDKAKGKVKGLRDKAVKKVLGTKDEDGKYSGGFASNLVNNFKEGTTDLEGTIKGAVNKMLYGDYVASKGKFDGFVVDEQGNATQKKDYGGVIGKLRKSFDGLNDFLFGEGTADDEHRSKAKWRKVKGAFKEAAPKMTAGAGIGAIAGLFLPGGPVLGAIFGSVTGLVKGSSSLNKYLFGEYSDEMEDVIDPETGKVATDWKGRKKTRKKQTKEGIFSRELQEGIKKMVPAGILGGIGGKLAGSGIVSLGNKLGILPATTSLLPFTIMGVGLGLMSTSDNFKKMIFGDVDDPKSGLISKDFRTKAIDTIKKVAPHAAGGAIIGSKMAGLMGKLGILPGFMFGPGGTIMTILGGITMGSQAEKINKFIFGEESEVEEDVKDKDGNVVGKKKKKVRQGGVFGQAYDFMKDKVMEPIAKGMNKVVKGIGNWFKEDVLGPLGRSIEPLKDKLKEAGGSIKESLSNIGNNIATGITQALGIVPGDQDMKTFWEKNVKGKLKQTFNKLFSGLGKLIGNILSAPFKALEAIVRGSTQPSEDDDGLGDGTGAPKKRKSLFDKWHDGMRDRRHKRQADRMRRAGAALGGAFRTAGGHINNIGMGFADFSDNVSTHIAQSINGLGGAASKVFGKKGANTSNPAAATSWSMAELQAMPVEEAIGNLQKKQAQGIPLTPAESSFMITFGRRRSNVATTQNRNINTDLKNATSRESDMDIDTDSADSKASRKQAKADAKEERRNRKKSANFAKDNHSNLKKIAKNTGKIYDEIRGQLGGVGWNVAYIKTLLENQYGPLRDDQLPEEMEGSKKVRKKRGFFGKIKDKAGDMFESFGNKLSEWFGSKGKKNKKGGKDGKGGGGGFAKFFKVISAPFRLIGGIGGFVSDMLLNIFDVIGSTIKLGITAIGETLKIGAELIKGAAKGIGSAIGDAAALFVGTLKDLALSVTSVLRGTLQFLMDTVPTLASAVVQAGVGLLKGGVKGVIGLGKAAASGIKGLGSKIKARRDKKKGITTKTKIESIGTFRIAGGNLDNAGETYPMIGDKLTPQPIPIVSISKGKAISSIPYAIPVYIANESIPTTIKKMTSNNNLDSDYMNTYKEVDRRAESSANPNEVYDKAIANAKTKEERDAILHAAQLNAAKQQLALGPGGSGVDGKDGEDGTDILSLFTGTDGGGITLKSILSGLGTLFGLKGVVGGVKSLFKTGISALANTKLGQFVTTQLLPTLSVAGNLAIPATVGGLGVANAVKTGDHSALQLAGRTFTTTGMFALQKADKVFDLAKNAAPYSVKEGRLLSTADKYTKVGTKMGDAVKGAGNKLVNFIKKCFNKLFGEAKIKDAIAKVSAGGGSLKEKILAAVSKNLDSAVVKLGEAGAEQILKKANIVLMVAGAVIDFGKGYSRADRYFNVNHSDLTFGMKLTAGLCNALSGLAFGLIPEEWLTTTIYNIVANAEDKQALKENQAKLQATVDQYNKENGTEYTVDEFQDKYKENGDRRSPGLFKGVWNVLTGKNWYGDEKSDEEKAKNQQQMQNNLDNFHALGAGRFGRGVTHYSQRDSRWNHGTNMATVGCGPTAAAMVGSAYGDNRNPLVANAMSYGMGMRASDGGMNPAFFSQYANSNYGMAQGPNSGAMVASNLAKGQPVVMMGKGGTFGSGMHYMVADKMVGKNKVNMVDPYTGGNKVSNLGSVMRNTSATVYSYGKGRGFGGNGSGSSQSFANVTSSTNGSSGRGNGFGGNVRGAQQALCNKMAAIEGKIKYTTSGVQDPDQGTASCASMCGWAYRKVFPDVFTSTPMSDNAYYSSQDSRFRTIYVNDGTQTFNMSMLQPGDLLYFDWRTERIMDGKMSHVDMYAGNGQVWYHGGDPIMGPVKKDMTNYRITHLMKVRRYTPFITGDVRTYDDSEVNYNGSSSTSDTDWSSDNTFLGQITGLLESAGNKISDFFSLKPKDDTSDTGSSSTTSGSASAAVISSTNLGMSSSTKENGKKIWKFFKDKGLSKNQIAGIMGNLYQESLLRPENVSDYFNSRTGITDKGYTDSVDNGTYSTFATDGEGYGLPMWTVSDNKGPLLESARRSNKSVGDLGLQLDFLWNDLNTKYKASLMDPIRQSDSLEDIAVKFMQVYEKPAGYTTDAKKNERINAARTVLSQFGTGRGDTTNLMAMNGRIKGMNNTMTKLAEFGRGESTAVMATKQIADAISSTDFGKGNGDGTTQQMLQLMTKTFGQIVSLLSDIKDNTSSQTSDSSSNRSKVSGKVARGDNYSADGSSTSLNTTDYGRMIVDNLTKR